jgi:hypothetical protein
LKKLNYKIMKKDVENKMLETLNDFMKEMESVK